MATCSVCGKKGIFLKVNCYGRCKECQEKHEDAERQQRQIEDELNAERRRQAALEKVRKRTEAEEYFLRLSELIKFIRADISANEDPVKRLDDIHLVEEKIAACDKFTKILSQYNDYEYFKNVLDEHFVYESDFDKRNKFGHIKEFSVVVCTNRDNYVERIIESLRKKVLNYKNGWRKTISRIKSDAAFQKELLSLPAYTVQINLNAVEFQVRKSLDEIKFSNVTAKTIYERLGTFVVINVETTGLKSMQDEIIEVGAIYFENWEPCLKFETFVKPTKEVTREITSITGITNSMVSDAPSFHQIIQSLGEFVGNKNLVGHNLLFDLRFLYSSGYDFTIQKRKYYDTLELSKRVLTSPSNGRSMYDGNFDVENHKLNTLCNYYEIRANASGHRAISDCLATGYLFKKLASTRTS